MQMIAICDKSNSNQWMFLAMLSTGLKKKIKINNISFYIQLYKQGRLKYHSSINEEDCLLSFAVRLFWKGKKNRQWWALPDEIYSTLMDIELRVNWNKSTVAMLSDTIQNDPTWILPKSYSDLYKQ